MRRVTVTGLLVLTTTVALGCGGAPKGSDDPLLDPVGAGAATTAPDDGSSGADPSDAALPGDDASGGDGSGNGSDGGNGGITGPVGGTSGNGTIDQGAGSGTDGAFPDGSPLPPTGNDPDTAELPGDPFGPAEATFRVGLASLTMGSTIHRLPRLASPGTYFHEFGSDVVWTSGDGWYLQVGGAKPNTEEGALPAYIAIDWVHDGQHWVTWDPSGCEIAIEKADKDGLAGTAKCKDMRWVDAIIAGLAEEPTPVPGQAAFSVRIEFQAAP